MLGFADISAAIAYLQTLNPTGIYSITMDIKRERPAIALEMERVCPNFSVSGEPSSRSTERSMSLVSSKASTPVFVPLSPNPVIPVTPQFKFQPQLTREQQPPYKGPIPRFQYNFTHTSPKELLEFKQKLIVDGEKFFGPHFEIVDRPADLIAEFGFYPTKQQIKDKKVHDCWMASYPQYERWWTYNTVMEKFKKKLWNETVEGIRDDAEVFYKKAVADLVPPLAQSLGEEVIALKMKHFDELVKFGSLPEYREWHGEYGGYWNKLVTTYNAEFNATTPDEIEGLKPNGEPILDRDRRFKAVEGGRFEIDTTVDKTEDDLDNMPMTITARPFAPGEKGHETYGMTTKERMKVEDDKLDAIMSKINVTHQQLTWDGSYIGNIGGIVSSLTGTKFSFTPDQNGYQHHAIKLHYSHYYVICERLKAKLELLQVGFHVCYYGKNRIIITKSLPNDREITTKDIAILKEPYLNDQFRKGTAFNFMMEVETKYSSLLLRWEDGIYKLIVLVHRSKSTTMVPDFGTVTRTTPKSYISSTMTKALLPHQYGNKEYDDDTITMYNAKEEMKFLTGNRHRETLTLPFDDIVKGVSSNLSSLKNDLLQRICAQWPTPVADLSWNKPHPDGVGKPPDWTLEGSARCRANQGLPPLPAPRENNPLRPTEMFQRAPAMSVRQQQDMMRAHDEMLKSGPSEPQQLETILNAQEVDDNQINYEGCYRSTAGKVGLMQCISNPLLDSSRFGEAQFTMSTLDGLEGYPPDRIRNAPINLNYVPDVEKVWELDPDADTSVPEIDIANEMPLEQRLNLAWELEFLDMRQKEWNVAAPTNAPFEPPELTEEEIPLWAKREMLFKRRYADTIEHERTHPVTNINLIRRAGDEPPPVLVRPSKTSKVAKAAPVPYSFQQTPAEQIVSATVPVSYCHQHIANSGTYRYTPESIIQPGSNQRSTDYIPLDKVCGINLEGGGSTSTIKPSSSYTVQHGGVKVVKVATAETICSASVQVKKNRTSTIPPRHPSTITRPPPSTATPTITPPPSTAIPIITRPSPKLYIDGVLYKPPPRTSAAPPPPRTSATPPPLPPKVPKSVVLTQPTPTSTRSSTPCSEEEEESDVDDDFDITKIDMSTIVSATVPVKFSDDSLFANSRLYRSSDISSMFEKTRAPSMGALEVKKYDPNEKRVVRNILIKDFEEESDTEDEDADTTE
jgi:hypothetical protein